jgi:hypothetical protein
VSLTAAEGSFLTSHVAECPDVAPECATTFIPPHKHVVSIGLTHLELQTDYGLGHNAQLTLRMPYDVKAMRVRYTTLTGEPFVPPYGDIHHRTETLTGISDPSLGIDWSPRHDWIFGVGTTLPAGHIVPDPIVLGREGKTHEHIQFGSGTFEPRLAAQWSHGQLFARAEGKLSVYENRNGYRAPTTFTWSLGRSIRAGRIAITPSLDGQYQTLGRWSGVVDEGSGFEDGGARLQVSFPWLGLTLSPGVYHQLWSHGFDEQTFRQNTTWSFSVAHSF